MAAGTIPQGGVKRTVIVESNLSKEDVEKARSKKWPELWEFLPTITDEEWQNHAYELFLYRETGVGQKRSFVEKIYQSIDHSWIQQKYGGGDFYLILKRGAQIIINGTASIEGPARMSDGSFNFGNGFSGGAAAPANNATLATLEAVRMAMNPEIMKSMMQMFMTAANESMQMIRQQMPVQQDPLTTLRNAKEILGIGAAPVASPMDDITKQFMQAAIGKMLNPPEHNAFKDTVQLINDVKAAGFLNAAPKTDLTTSFVNNLPMIADRLVAGLHEYRLQAESTERAVRIQRGEISAGDPNVITVPAGGDPAAPGPQAPASQPAQQAPTRIEHLPPEVTAQVIMQANLQRLVLAMKEPNCTGEHIYDYLYHVWPEMLAEMAQFNSATLLMFFKSRETQITRLGNDVLFQLADAPQLPRLIDEFLAYAKKVAQEPTV